MQNYNPSGFPKFDIKNLPKSYRFKTIEEFIILEEIGKGGYSKVYLVQNKKSGKKYALKACHKFKKDKDRSDRSYTEIAVLRKLNHPNIISLKGWFEDKETIYLVLEHVPERDCAKYFKHVLPDKNQLRTIMRQLVNVLEYIHNQGIVHRDIKLENILINGEMQIKLIDFGLCAIKEDPYEMIEGTVGTVRYTAPELLSGKYNESVDIWGLGIILFMLLTGKYPFDGSKKESIFARIREKNIHYSNYNLEKRERSLLRKLLNKSPEDRIEIEDVLNEPFFSS
jgi:serine/threonine protein kinase